MERKAQAAGILSGAFSAPTGLTIVAAGHLPHTHITNLAPVPGVSELLLQVLIGFGVLHIK